MSGRRDILRALAGALPAAAIAEVVPRATWQERWAPEANRDGLRAFEGLEDDRANSHPAAKPHIFVQDNNYRFNMHMVDRDTSTDRQRHEVKGMRWPAGGSYLNLRKGEIWRLTYSMYIPDSLRATTTFTHIMQLKIPGSGSAPILVTSLRRYSGVQKIEMKVFGSNTTVGYTDLVPLHNKWISSDIQFTIGDSSTGRVRWILTNGSTTVLDKTKTGVDLWLNDRVRPKWGIYRSMGDSSGSLRDCYLLINNMRAYQWA